MARAAEVGDGFAGAREPESLIRLGVGGIVGTHRSELFLGGADFGRGGGIDGRRRLRVFLAGRPLSRYMSFRLSSPIAEGRTMDPNLGISAFAAVMSVVAFTISTMQGRHERERTIRNQLSEVLRQIASVSIEKQKLTHDASPESSYVKQMSSAYDQQQSFLLQQAKYLADQIPSLVNSVELTAIGYSNALAGDLLAAETYYSRALSVAKEPLYKLMAARSYAWFLFTQRRFEEGREQYRKIVSERFTSDNYGRYQKGLTYQFWGENERLWAENTTASQQAYESATSEFRGIDMGAFRDFAMKALEASKVTSFGQSQAAPVPTTTERPLQPPDHS